MKVRGLMTEVWFIELIRQPGNAQAVFGHRSRHNGRTIWGTIPWMAPVDPVTEIETLEELYRACMDLMEHRATI